MSTFTRLALLLLALLALPSPAAAKLRVVATVPSLAAVARDIAGEDAEVKALVLPTQDPHWVDARPNLALELSRADLLLIVGLELEVGWLPNLQTGSRNAAIQKGGKGYLDVSQFVNLREAPTAPVDRSQGDIHPGGNPHFLHDPRSVEAIAYGIARRMGELDPEHAAGYLTRAQTLAVTLARKIPEWEARLAPLRGMKLVAYHKSWPYAEAWLGFEIVEYVEPKPGIPPNPAHVAQVLGAMRRHGVPAIIEEAYYSDATVEQISERTGARILRIPGGVHFVEGETYVEHMEEFVGLLAQLVPGGAP